MNDLNPLHDENEISEVESNSQELAFEQAAIIFTNILLLNHKDEKENYKNDLHWFSSIHDLSNDLDWFFLFHVDTQHAMNVQMI